MKKRCNINRRGYFFLIDSVIALTVLAIGAFLIFSMYSNIPSKEQPAILSDDIMDFLANNKLSDVNNDYVGLTGSLWSTEGEPGGLCPGENFIAVPDKTLLQQIGEFYHKSNTINTCYSNIIIKFIEELTVRAIPPEYSFEVWLGDAGSSNLLYPVAELTIEKEATDIIIPSRRIVYGIADKQTGEMFGPYSVEVLLWR